MDQYAIAVAFAVSRIPALLGRADRRRPASSRPEVPVISGQAMASAMGHAHQPGRFDPGHCRSCARRAGLMDYYNHVQREAARIEEARARASQARRYAIWALGSAGVSVLLAVVDLGIE
jgi:hypothetical protein